MIFAPRLLYSLLIGLFAQLGMAQTISWTGAGDGTTWGDVNNWNPVRLPTNGDHVYIENAPSVKTTSTIHSISSICLKNSTLQIAHPTTLENTDTFSISLLGSLLTNESELKITGSVGHAVIIDANSQIENKDSLIICNPDDFGIENQGSLFNSSTGVLIIEDALAFGPMRNANEVDNFGKMYITRTHGILNNNMFHNKASGEIYFNNQGASVISAQFFNQGELINDGLMAFSNSNEDAYLQQGVASSCQNNKEIWIDSMGFSGLRINGGTFTNQGLINMRHIDRNAIDFANGTINNHDSIMIEDIADDAINLANGGSSSSQFNNLSTGVVSITSTVPLSFSSNVIHLSAFTELVNAGIIMIDNGGRRGIYVREGASMQLTDGVLTLMDSYDGLALEDAAVLTIGPAANLVIQGITGFSGLYLDDGVTLDAVGKMTIDP